MLLDAVLHPGTGDYLLDSEWIVTDVARSGVRLRPVDPVRAWTPRAWASGPVCPGVIQVPSDGQPIVLGPDAGTTGGYPIAGVLTRQALGALGYAPVDAVARFRSVTPPVLDAERVVTVRW
jgi:allophanate hydrolase subunit 2